MEGNTEKTRKEVNKPGFAMRVIFGIFMVLVYLAVGILFIVNHFFGAVNSEAIALVIGIMLIVYGIWRGYRVYRNWP